MEEIFKDGASYRRELNGVYTFHKKVYDTVLAYLQKHGDRVITDEDNEPEPWNFCFLDVEGSFEITAVRLTSDKKDFYLDALSENGYEHAFYWSDINHDMIIVEMLMSLVFPSTENE